MTALKLELNGDTQAIITRRFAAPPALVYRAHVEPALLQRWCLGPDGWEMHECTFEARVGGRFLYRWRNAEGHGFHADGEILEIEPGKRILHVERMYLPDPTPDNRVETQFIADGSGTLMKMTMTVPNAEIREAMLATGMTDGMEISYERMERVLSGEAESA